MVITDDYVSFELAKLLKEKGFNCGTHCYYEEDDIKKKRIQYNDIIEDHNENIVNDEFDINMSSGKMSAPTIQMVLKWFRDVHKIGIFPSAYNFFVGDGGSPKQVYGTKIVNLNLFEPITQDMMPMPTYEKATESAIKYCLENLI